VNGYEAVRCLVGNILTIIAYSLAVTYTNSNLINGMLLTMMVRNILPFILVVFATGANADGESIVTDKTYACMSVTPAVGMTWNGGRWETHRFSDLEKFLLNVVVIQDVNNRQFLHFNIKGDGEEKHCGTVYNPFDMAGLSCMQLGISVLFSEKTGNGGISFLLGSTSNAAKRDDLAVMPFTCQKF
jgi:hypothetical protein